MSRHEAANVTREKSARVRMCAPAPLLHARGRARPSAASVPHVTHIRWQKSYSVRNSAHRVDDPGIAFHLPPPPCQLAHTCIHRLYRAAVRMRVCVKSRASVQETSDRLHLSDVHTAAKNVRPLAILISSERDLRIR